MQLEFFPRDNSPKIQFPTSIDEIMERISMIDPVKYAWTRNFVNGSVTYLSPYISRGVISTRQVYEYVMSLGIPWEKSEKFIQELAWRDYWQRIWIEKGDDIHTDLKNTQTPVTNHQIPAAIFNACTGIEAVDKAIKELYETGYMHNHMRMYVASICCNVANSHWSAPAKWMYAHLLDGDLASNHLSWQWVSGAFSNKKYYANQENINRYFQSKQTNTFLDLDYEQLTKIEIPSILAETVSFDSSVVLPITERPILQKDKTTLLYNYYNLDPSWQKDEDVQRILLLEPSIFKKYPVSQKSIDFTLSLAQNIPNIQVFVGEFDDLANQVSQEKIIFKEHPLNVHYKGQIEPRDWLCHSVEYYTAFFPFWKKCQQELQR